MSKNQNLIQRVKSIARAGLFSGLCYLCSAQEGCQTHGPGQTATTLGVYGNLLTIPMANSAVKQTDPTRAAQQMNAVRGVQGASTILGGYGAAQAGKSDVNQTVNVGQGGEYQQQNQQEQNRQNPYENWWAGDGLPQFFTCSGFKKGTTIYNNQYFGIKETFTVEELQKMDKIYYVGRADHEGIVENYVLNLDKGEKLGDPNVKLVRKGDWGLNVMNEDASTFLKGGGRQYKIIWLEDGKEIGCHYVHVVGELPKDTAKNK